MTEFFTRHHATAAHIIKLLLTKNDYFFGLIDRLESPYPTASVPENMEMFFEDRSAGNYPRGKILET